MNKLYGYVAGGLSVVGGLLYAGVAHAETFSTTTLGTAIDTVSGTTYDYFGVLITKFWPFLLGAVILIGILVFGKRIIRSMFGR